MKRTILAALAALALLGTSVSAQQNTAAPADASAAAAMDAQTFVQKAFEGNKVEMLSSRSALRYSTTAKVQQFAQMMIDDHSKADADMRAALKQAGIKVTMPSALDSEHQAMVDGLKGLKGADFDKKYIELQKAAHDDAVALFTNYSQNGDNEALKAFATATLPTLQKHKDQVNKL